MVLGVVRPTKAAIAAGTNPRYAAERGSKWTRLNKVQRYYYELTKAARDERAEETRDAVTNLTEVLTTLTSHMRAPQAR